MTWVNKPLRQSRPKGAIIIDWLWSTRKRGASPFTDPSIELFVLSVPCKDAALFQIAALRGDWRSFWDLVFRHQLSEPVCPDLDLFDVYWWSLAESGAPHRSWTCEWWPVELWKVLHEQSVGTLFCLTSLAAIDFERFLRQSNVTPRDVWRAAKVLDGRRISKKEATAVLAYVHELLEIAKASSDRFLVGLVNRRGEGW